MNALTQTNLVRLLSAALTTIEVCRKHQTAPGTYWDRMLAAAETDLHRARGICYVGEESSTQLEAVALEVEKKLKETLNGK